jgi:hypothetical protein
MLECEFCETKFLSEDQLDKHSCRERVRMEQLGTTLGMQAFKCYQQWFKCRKFTPPQKRAFIASPLYNSFLKYVKFRKKMGIPDDKIYIGIMAEENILPQHWYNDDIYRFAMKKFDSDYPVKTHVRITLVTLDRLKRIYGCDEISDVFNHLRPSDAIKLIQTRNLSPWFLLLSSRFKKYLHDETTKEERGLISNAMNLKHWKLMLEIKKRDIPETKKYIKQLNL